MVKRKTNEKEQNPVTICDQSIEVVAICDHLEKSNKDLSQSEIENLILTIRGQQVLIDRDLAGIYKVETKRLNEQVRRNIERFPDRYRFQLTKEEMMELVVKNGPNPASQNGENRPLQVINISKDVQR